MTLGALARTGTAIALLAALGCNGFGTNNSTEPGSTPNTQSQTAYRMVGNVGTPFSVLISDQRSSWQINGTAPLSIIIANGLGPTRIVGTKTTNDTRLLSVELINGFDVKVISSTFANYGTVVASFGGRLNTLAAPASPDVRFFVKGPAAGIFNAVVEDETTAYVLQSRAPTIILYDSPNNNSQYGRVDGIFTQVSSGGPLSIDLSFNGHITHAGGNGTVSIKFP